MSEYKKLIHLTNNMNLETAEDYESPIVSRKQQDSLSFSSAQLPNGRKISLLKTLLTSACERNCYYCPFRSGRNFRRATLAPEELASAFIALYEAGVIQGLFLSSGVSGSGPKSQDKLITCVEIIRNKYHFTGYIHLKIMPGTERDQIERSMQLVDRISINLEAPNEKCLASLAPKKDFFNELIQAIKWINEIKQKNDPFYGWKNTWPSMVTQFVVGAVEDTDKEILSTTKYMHSNFNLGRAYYSSFKPVLDTPLENKSPTPPKRQLRLYQASYLIRDYGFNIDELDFSDTGNLFLESDPKLSWANSNLLNNPIEINKASKNQLLRIPGIGLKGARAILKNRIRKSISSTEDLRRIGINPSRVVPYILLNGKRPEYQTSFL
jgi:predicted DNA-binding helix-hairpin-helix protein